MNNNERDLQVDLDDLRSQYNALDALYSSTIDIQNHLREYNETLREENDHQMHYIETLTDKIHNMPKYSLNSYADLAHSDAIAKGFWKSYYADDNAQNLARCQKLLLIVSEVSEATEALRKEDFDNYFEELADVFIRLADLVGWEGIDFDGSVRRKMDTNKTRPVKHDKKF